MPRKSASVTRRPSGPSKARSGTGFGARSTFTAATSPRARGARRCASTVAARQSPAALLPRPERLPYRAAAATAAATSPPMRTRRRERGASVMILEKRRVEMSNRMWGGRFASGPAEIMEEINASIDFDKRLAPQDIRGSLAHAAMLGATGILPRDDVKAIEGGLEAIRAEIETGEFTFSRALEDIHMNVEQRLPTSSARRRAGCTPPAHATTRSRPTCGSGSRDAVDRLDAQIAELQAALADKALAFAACVMPGFTHLQSAQPVTFGHHLLAYVEMLARDRGRFADARRRLERMPARRGGARRHFLPDRPIHDRDGPRLRPADRELARFRLRPRLPPRDSRCGLDLRHASLPLRGGDRALDDRRNSVSCGCPTQFTTGSSIMPQKRNPDAAELVRGKAGRIFGALQALLVVMKGLPLTYSKDMQEDKEGAFDAVHSLSLCLAATAGMVRDLEPDRAGDEALGRRRLLHRDGPRRLARAGAAPALPRGAPRDRAARGDGGRAEGRPREALARGHALGRAADHGRGLRGARASTDRSAAARATAAPPLRTSASRPAAGLPGCGKEGKAPAPPRVGDRGTQEGPNQRDADREVSLP